MRRVAIVSGARIPFCRSVGKYADLDNTDLMVGALKALVKKNNLAGKHVDEVMLGAVLKRSKDFNLARECAISAGLAPTTVGADITQACGTSLEAAILLGAKIATGLIDTAIAGGCDTSSDVPIEFSRSFSNKLVQLSKARTIADKLKLISKLRPSDLAPKLPAIKEPRTKLSMGEHCELMAKQWRISREDQDQLSLESHKNASRSYFEGYQNSLVDEFHNIKQDDNVRADSTLEKMAKLKPAFDREGGTLTAANSSPLTDGASCVFLCSEDYAKENNLEVMAYLTHSQTAAVDFVGGDGLLMAPTVAVGKMLSRASMKLQDFDFYEIHEAFAAQVLCTLKAWEDQEYCQKYLGLDNPLGSIDRSKLNVNGSSLAFGHPFAATGTRILANAAKLINEKGGGKALISLCTAGGMGVVAIVEK